MGIESGEPKIEPQEDKPKIEQPEDKPIDDKQKLDPYSPFIIIKVNDDEGFLL